MAREGTLTLTFDFLAFLTNSVLTGNHKGQDLTNLKINNLIQRPKTWTNKQGNESFSLRDSIAWNRIPDEYKAAKRDTELKMKIRS